MSRPIMGGALTPVILFDSENNLIGTSTTNPLYFMSMAVLSSNSDVSSPAVNTAAAVTYAATAGRRHIISGVAWSYNAKPTGGRLYIQDGAGIVFDIDITYDGPGFFEFPYPKAGTVNTSMTITLTAAGAAVTGSLSILNHWEETV